MSIMNDLNTIGINPFGVQLVAESLLRSPVAQRTIDDKPLAFFFPVQRSDCAEWVGVEITLKAVRATLPAQEPSHDQ